MVLAALLVTRELITVQANAQLTENVLTGFVIAMLVLLESHVTLFPQAVPIWQTAQVMDNASTAHVNAVQVGPVILAVVLSEWHAQRN